MLMKGLKTQDDGPVKQTAHMDHQVLKSLFKYVDLTSELEEVAWTAILVGFSLVLRITNLGPVSRTKFDAKSNLLRSDYVIRKNIPTIGIRWSKTNQYRNRTNWSPLIPSSDKEICPIWWINNMCKIIPASDDEPLFLVREKGERLPLAASQIRRLLKKWCKSASVDHKKFTPHCLRRGGLNWAHKADLTGESLKVLGDWSTQVYNKYLDLDFAERVRSGQKMQQFIENSYVLQCSREPTEDEFEGKDNGRGVDRGHPPVGPVHQSRGTKAVQTEACQQRSSHILQGYQRVKNQTRDGLISTGNSSRRDK